MVTILLQPSPWLSPLLPFTLNRTRFIKEPIGVTFAPPPPKSPSLPPNPFKLTFVFASHFCIFWARLSLRLFRHHFWDSSSSIIVYWYAWEDHECRWVRGSVDFYFTRFCANRIKYSLRRECSSRHLWLIRFFFFSPIDEECCVFHLFFSFGYCCTEEIVTWFAPALPSKCKTQVAAALKFVLRCY